MPRDPEERERATVSVLETSLSENTHHCLRLRSRFGTGRSSSSSHALDGSQSRLFDVRLECLTKRVQTIGNSSEKKPDSCQVYARYKYDEHNRNKATRLPSFRSASSIFWNSSWRRGMWSIIKAWSHLPISYFKSQSGS